MRQLLLTLLLLTIFAAPLSAPADEPEMPAPITIVSSERSTDQDKVEAIQQSLLTHPGRIDVVDTSLEEVVAHLSDRWDVPIRIRNRPLEEVALSSDIPVTMRLEGISRDTLLRWMLKESDLVYDIDATGIVITTEDDLKKHGRVTRVYPVSDLIDNVFTSEKGLIEVITNTVEPESWSALGGPGEIALSNGSLIVEQTLAIQTKVRGLLETVRQVKNLPGDSYDVSPRPISPLAARSQELRKRMESTRVSVDFADLPLEEAIAFLADAGKIPIRIDNRSLEETGLSSDMPVFCRLSNVSLEAALDVMLAEIDLCWIIDNDLLVITTPERQERFLTIRVYPVRDLVWQGLNVTDPKMRLLFRKQAGFGWVQKPFNSVTGNGWGFRGGFSGTSDGGNGFGISGSGGRPVPTMQGFGEFFLVLGANLPVLPQYGPLAEAIQQTIHADSWEDLGGPGSLEVYGDGDCFVIDQIGPVHERIEQLLAELRAQQSPDAAAELLKRFEAAQTELVLQTYAVSRPEWLKSKIEAKFVPDSWDGEEHFVDIVEKTIVIRHRREVQREIYDFLVEQGEASPLTKYFPTWKTGPSAIRGDHMPGGNF